MNEKVTLASSYERPFLLLHGLPGFKFFNSLPICSGTKFIKNASHDERKESGIRQDATALCIKISVLFCTISFISTKRSSFNAGNILGESVSSAYLEINSKPSLQPQNLLVLILTILHIYHNIRLLFVTTIRTL